MGKPRLATTGFVLGSILLVFLACDSTPTEPEVSVGFQTVLKAVLPGDSPDLPEQEAIRDRATWQAAWTKLHNGNPPPLPEVDFGREMIILALGPGCCSEVEILSILREQGELVVSIHVKESSNTVCALPDFTAHAVRLSRFQGPVRFIARRGEGFC
jgi:hypothetical protein